MIDHEKIQAFLNVVQHGNITAAANASYTSQSHISKQIRTLEEELGTQLIIRSKGHSEISLTPHGSEFLKTARRWEGIMKDFEQIPYTGSVTEISIGALDRLQSYTLRNFYRSVLKEHPEIRLDCHTRHSREIYAMMEAQQFDFGLVSVLYPVYNIKVKKLCAEPLYVICAPGNKLPAVIEPSSLNPEQEIYSRWSDEFEVWHDQLWPKRQYRIHVGTSAMTPDYLDEPGRWSIVPAGTIRGLKESHDFTVHRLSVPSPSGSIFLLEQKHRNPSKTEALAAFRESLLAFLTQEFSEQDK